MKKLFYTSILILLGGIANAQYSKINDILDELETRKGIQKNIGIESIDDKKFILIKDFEDHTERQFIIIKGNKATYVEIFDDKKTGKSSSNVFTGDMIRTNKNVVSCRFDELEGKKIGMPISKTLLLTKQKNAFYLLDANSKERWIDEDAISKK